MFFFFYTRLHWRCPSPSQSYTCIQSKNGRKAISLKRYWDICSLFLASVAGLSCRLIQLSVRRLGMKARCCPRCLASSNSCPINLYQSRQTESEKWRWPACANINPKFPASVPSWPWFGMTSICWLDAHISLQIVWARLICFYARLVQNVMPRYLLGTLPMWCRGASDRQERKVKKRWLRMIVSLLALIYGKRRPAERVLERFTADMSPSGTG